jgi:hypothetical protein
MFESFLRKCGQSVNDVGATYAAGYTVSLQVVVDTINLVLRLLVGRALPENLIGAVGLCLRNEKGLCVVHALSMAQFGREVKKL